MLIKNYCPSLCFAYISESIPSVRYEWHTWIFLCNVFFSCHLVSTLKLPLKGICVQRGNQKWILMDSMGTPFLEGLVTSIRLKNEIHTNSHLLLQMVLAAARTIHFINSLRQVLVEIFPKLYSLYMNGYSNLSTII